MVEFLLPGKWSKSMLLFSGTIGNGRVFVARKVCYFLVGLLKMVEFLLPGKWSKSMLLFSGTIGNGRKVRDVIFKGTFENGRIFTP